MIYFIIKLPNNHMNVSGAPYRLSHHAKQRHISLISTGPRAVHEGSLNEGWRAGFGAALKMYRNIQLSSSVKSS